MNKDVKILSDTVANHNERRTERTERRDQVHAVHPRNARLDIDKSTRITYRQKEKTKITGLSPSVRKNHLTKFDICVWLKKKKTSTSGYRDNVLRPNKGPMWQAHSWHHTQWGKQKGSPLRSGRRQGCPLSPPFFTMVLQNPASAIRQEKRQKASTLGRQR